MRKVITAISKQRRHGAATSRCCFTFLLALCGGWLCSTAAASELTAAVALDPSLPAVASPAPTTAPATDLSETLQIDNLQSLIHFRIGLMLFFDAEGTFDKVDGSIELSADEVLVRARIPVESATMSNAKYEAMLEGPFFLDGQDHPYIEFSSDPIARAGIAERKDVPGKLCLRGVCQREVFQLLEVDCQQHQGRQRQCLMTVSGAIQRSRYGMRTHRGALRNRIELRMRLVAVGSASPPQAELGGVGDEVRR